MDPISAIFASYLDIVSNSVSEHTADILGTEIQSVIVEHEDVKVPYTYQMWRIKEPSVCASYKDDFNIYSNCTLTAKSLFSNVCESLQKNPRKHWKHRKIKNMYCNAAISYKPTMATVNWTQNDTTFDDARSECNTAKAEFLGRSDSVARKKISKACKKYEALKAGK